MHGHLATCFIDFAGDFLCCDFVRQEFILSFSEATQARLSTPASI